MIEVVVDKNKSDKLIVILDASALKESSCILRLFNNTVMGYTGRINDNVIEFGTAFHLFVSHLREHGKEGFGEAVRMACHYYENTPMRVSSDKKYLTSEFLSTTCLGYFTTYLNDTLEVIKYPREMFPLLTEEDEAPPLVPLIEPWTKFMFPYFSNDFVDILMAGTMDEIGLKSRGCLTIVDRKTSGVWKLKEYLDGYKLDPQLIFYTWALKRYAAEHPDSIFADLINKYPLGAMIDGVFYKGADNPVEFARSNVFLFPQNLIDDMERAIKYKVNQLVEVIGQYLKDGTLPIREGISNSSCKTLYGACKYSVSCAMPDKESRQVMLDSGFTIRHYNPLNFGGK